MSANRTLAAVLFAPLVIPGYFLVLMDSAGGQQSAIDTLVVIYPVTIFSYLGTIGLGLPAVLFLKRIGHLSLPKLAIMGALTGLVVWFAATRFFTWISNSYFIFSVIDTVWGAVLGFTIAALFGIISRLKFSNETKHET